jgi:hypothetical protein
VKKLLLILLFVLCSQIAFSANVSLSGVKFNITDFSFASSTYAELVSESFNTTAANTTLIIMSSMNVLKLSGEETTKVFTRIKIDGGTILEEGLRTISVTGEEGSTGTKPISFSLANGTHNLTMEFRRTGDGSVEVNDMDLLLGQLITNDGGSVRGQLILSTYNFSSRSFTRAFNWSITKNNVSAVFTVVKQTVLSNRTNRTALPNNQTFVGGINMSDNVLLYHFDNNSNFGESDSFFFDFSYQGNSGSCTGVNCPTEVSGLFNKSKYFDGIDDRVEIASTSDINLGTHQERTIECWFNIEDKSEATKQVIYEEGGPNRGLNIYVQSNILYMGGWNTPGANSWAGTFLTTTNFKSDTWHHITLVLNGTTTVQNNSIRGYVDGVEFGRGQGSQLLSQGGDIKIGMNGDTKFHDGNDRSEGEFFNGTIDEFAIYNRVLSAQEILDRSNKITNIVAMNFENIDDGHQSPYWSRFLSNPFDTGSVSGNWIDTDVNISVNFSIRSRNTYDAETTISQSVLDFDLINNNSALIANFQASNPLTNLTNTVLYNAGKNLVANYSHTLVNGTSIFIAMTSSFSSTTDDQTPVYYIDAAGVPRGNCFSKKERYLDCVTDIGNAFIYTICTNLTPGNTYNFSLWVNVSAGEQIEQLDESLSGFEVVPFATAAAGFLPPLANEIITPHNASYQTGYKNITWRAFDDPDGHLVTYNVTLRNSSGAVFIINGSTTNLFQPINYSFYPSGAYTVTVEGCDPLSLCANSTNSFWIDNIAPTVTLVSPPNSTIFSGTQNIIFVCSAFDNLNLKNISLLLTNNQNQNMTMIETAVASGVASNASFIVRLGVGTYSWNCLAHDAAGNSNRSNNNNTFRIKSVTRQIGGGGGSSFAYAASISPETSVDKKQQFTLPPRPAVLVSLEDSQDSLQDASALDVYAQEVDVVNTRAFRAGGEASGMSSENFVGLIAIMLALAVFIVLWPKAHKKRK